jgi:hypothetical protein
VFSRRRCYSCQFMDELEWRLDCLALPGRLHGTGCSDHSFRKACGEGRGETVLRACVSECLCSRPR